MNHQIRAQLQRLLEYSLKTWETLSDELNYNLRNNRGK